MSKVAIITDLHWGTRNNSLFFLDMMERFWYDFFFPYLEEKDIDTVWCLGDILESRKTINIQILTRVQKFFAEFNKRNIDLYTILGNHDVFYKTTNEISGVPPIIKPYDNIHLVADPFEVIHFWSEPVAFVNWITPENKQKVMHWIQTVDANILCGHFEINNFELAHGVACRTAWFDADWFSRFDKVLSGHFHVRATNGLINYLGNPYQTNWGEAADKKGFHIFDVHSKDIEFIVNPYEIYQTLYVDETLKAREIDGSDFKDKFVRIFIDGNVKKKQLDILIDNIGAFAHSIEVIEERQIMVDSEEIEQLTDVHDIITSFLNFCEIDNLDKGVLEKMIYEIHREALENVCLD